MISKISFENKSGYKLKITYDDKTYNLDSTQRVLIPVSPDEEPKMFKVSIDEEYCFDRVMFASRKSEILTVDRSSEICFFTKFDMLICDNDITTRKVVINQHIRRYEFNVVFALLTLDVNIPVSYSFCANKQKLKFRIFNLLNFMIIETFFLLLGCAGIMALHSGFDTFNIIFGVIACLTGFGFFVKSTLNRYKLIRFDKYFKDILLFESVPCLPLKIRNRTIVFDDKE